MGVIRDGPLRRTRVRVRIAGRGVLRGAGACGLLTLTMRQSGPAARLFLMQEAMRKCRERGMGGGRRLMTISSVRDQRIGPAALTDEELHSFVGRPLAACSDTALDPDEWFPIAAGATRARAEASRALAVCATCPVRAECLELSLRHWSGAGRHGIWGGLVEADRSSLRREWLKGVPVTALLSSDPAAGKSWLPELLYRQLLPVAPMGSGAAGQAR